MAVERVYVVESKYDEFVKLAVEYAKKFMTGYTTELNTAYSMGPVTDPRQVKIIDRHLEDALAKGATLLTGGKEQGMFYDPMVLVNVDHSMLLMRDETFGPLLPIMKVKDEAEAIRMANDNAYGLCGSVWSRDERHAKRVANQIQAAAVIVNDCMAQFGIPMLPFGGVKDSGFGRTHGQEGFDAVHAPNRLCAGRPALQVGRCDDIAGERALRAGNGDHGCGLWRFAPAALGDGVGVVEEEEGGVSIQIVD